jgi:MoxR-like ATPase
MTHDDVGGGKLMSPAEAQRAKELFGRLGGGLRAALFGQDDLIDATLTALAARGHLLLEGLPGLGKTELVKTLAALLDLSFRRVQFTPDLLPSDVTGGVVLEEKNGGAAFGSIRGRCSRTSSSPTRSTARRRRRSRRCSKRCRSGA